MVSKSRNPVVWILTAMVAFWIVFGYYFYRKYRVVPVVVAIIDTGDVADGHTAAVSKTLSTYCPECHILPIHVAHQGPQITPEDLIQAIRSSLDHRARVINFPSGIVAQDDALRSVMDEATHQGAVVVTAAGQGREKSSRGRPLDQLYPQAYPQAIVVGLPGPASNFGNALDFVVDPSSMVPAGDSSLAAAEISGLVAQTLRIRPGTSPEWMRHLLRMSTEAPSQPDFEHLGYGVFKSPDAFIAQEAKDIAYRAYRMPSGWLIDLSSPKEIEMISSYWECPSQKTRVGAELKANSLKKGRARIQIGPKPSEDCKVQVRMILEESKAKNLEIHLER